MYAKPALRPLDAHTQASCCTQPCRADPDPPKDDWGGQSCWFYVGPVCISTLH